MARLRKLFNTAEAIDETERAECPAEGRIQAQISTRPSDTLLVPVGLKIYHYFKAMRQSELYRTVLFIKR